MFLFQEKLNLIEEPEPECNAWYSLDLVTTLLQLGQTKMYNDVLQIFQTPLKKCPEILLCSLSLVNVTVSFLFVLVGQI